MSRPDPAQFQLFSGRCAQAEPAVHAPAAPREPGRPPEPAMRMCVLGSGSGGNSTAVQWGGSLLMIDLGFGPATIARRLDQAGLSPERISAVCLTHLDQDHFRPHWIPTLLGWKIPVFLHRWHLQEFCGLEGGRDLYDKGLVRVFENDGFSPAPGVSAWPVHLPHDLKGTSGFLVETPGGRIGYATDLGCVPADLIERFAAADLLAIESNYDPQMQMGSARPLFLKRRIMGQAGHLSNQQAFEAVRAIARRSPRGSPAQVVLLHRSRQCNDPRKVREVFAQDPDLARRVVLTEQRRRSRWFTVRPAIRRDQMAMPM